MKLIDKINKFINKKKGKILIKSKFGLSTIKNCAGYMTDIGQVDGVCLAANPVTFAPRIPKDQINAAKSTLEYKEIEEIYFRNTDEAKNLISNVYGVVTIDFGTINQQYEGIRVSYDVSSLDLAVLFKIYSFTNGDKAIFVKDSRQKNEFSGILNSISITSISFIDLVDFE